MADAKSNGAKSNGLTLWKLAAIGVSVFSCLLCGGLGWLLHQLGEAADGRGPFTEFVELERRQRYMSERAGFQTKIPPVAVNREVPEPPGTARLELVKYQAPLGENWAYVTPVEAGADKAAVVYVHGGFDWSLGDVWSQQDVDNDQSGQAFQREDLVVMYPSLRGSHDNQGRNECFLGEVDDLVAAGEYLAARADVDSSRVYLAGHSTGATLAMLVAARASPFWALVAFGPLDSPVYEGGCLPDNVDDLELRIRSPIEYVDGVQVTTWVVEGAELGNADAAEALQQYAANAPVRFVLVPGLDHFSVLAPGTSIVAEAFARRAPLEDWLTAEKITERRRLLSGH